MKGSDLQRTEGRMDHLGLAEAFMLRALILPSTFLPRSLGFGSSPATCDVG